VSRSFVLSYSASHLPAPEAIDPEAALAETEAFWRAWAGQCKRPSQWAEPVLRSLITLKALTYRPTGAMVAAVTTSLPEKIGGERNWDYRFCWLRDATFTLLALMDAGYDDEARAWREWLLRAVAGSPSQTQIMYGLAGERHLFELKLPWLPGYKGSKPVRIGNAAYVQLQVDVFGELLDALHQARHVGLVSSERSWNLQSLIDHLETIWDQPDEGIWEVRGPRQHFTFSKVMAWVSLDRMIKGVEEFGLDGDPRVRGTIEAIERHLTSTDSSCAMTHAPPKTDCPQEKVYFWPAASGLPTPSFLDAPSTRVLFLSVCLSCAMMSVDWRRNMTPWPDGSSATFLKHFRKWDWSTRAVNLTQRPKPAEQRSATNE
jgi:hypothetical protein